MATMWVIPPLDPRENLSASLLSCSESVSIQHLRLQAREERLHHRIVEAIANATHGTRDSKLPAARGEGHSRVFPAVIGMVVGSRTGAPTLGSGGCSTAFAVALNPAAIVTFPAPATSNVACEFLALRSPARFLPRHIGPMRRRRLSAGPDATGSC